MWKAATWIAGAATAALIPGWILLPNAPSEPASAAIRAEVIPNDNRVPAGELRAGVLTVALVAGSGPWFPEKGDGPAHEIHAFGTESGGLTNPGPLLRVPAGTDVRGTLRNTIPGSTLLVYGLRREPGVADTLHVPPGGTREIRFRAPPPGTYLYWATTQAAPTLRDRYGPDSQLVGVLIVDPPGALSDDHVFVIGIEDEAGPVPAERPLRAAVVNGRSWPHSLTYEVREGDAVRMRWINASDRPHPIHLHGFYFRVDSKGDLSADTLYEVDQRRLAVTELMMQGQTMSLTWVPERAGNWLMHCHMALHMSPALRRAARPAGHKADGNHTLEMMAGIVTGWRVTSPGPRPDARTSHTSAARTVRLLVQSAPAVYGTDPGLGFVIQSDATPPAADSVVIPGPPLVLRRGEPVQITVVNRSTETTSIHWHGIELDSYFDGVSGWSGDAARTSPPVPPGDSFVVRFNPPRAGTFIYHSHFDEDRQLGSGLYGPIIVLEPGATHDPRTDQPWILSQSGPGDHRPVMLNGAIAPVLSLDAGVTHRVRLININPNLPLVLSVLADSVPARWRAVAKDGADLPPAQVRLQPAVQRIGVGEAYDFELRLDQPGELKLRATDPAGRVRLSGTVRVR